MNLNQLEYFISAAENLNFTKAARECFISQTAMTQQIQSLEKSIGVPLFIRDKHHVELTPAGEVYLKEARTIIRRSDEALRLARMASVGTEGEIIVGFISGFGQSDSGEILRGFHTAFPNIKIKLFRDTMSGLVDAILRGEIDVAFTLQPHQHNYSKLNHKYIRSYPMVAAIESSHSLAEKEAIACDSLINEKFIIMQPAGRSRDEMEEMLWVYERGGFLPEVVSVEKEPETIMVMVSLGLGVCILPEYVTRLYRNNENVKFLPVINSEGNAETLDFEMIWTGDNTNPAVDRLLQWWGQE